MKIIHAGLNPTPKLKAELNTLIAKLNQVSANKRRHLADVGLLLKIHSDELKALSDKAFEEHKKLRDSD